MSVLLGKGLIWVRDNEPLTEVHKQAMHPLHQHLQPAQWGLLWEAIHHQLPFLSSHHTLQTSSLGLNIAGTRMYPASRKFKNISIQLKKETYYKVTVTLAVSNPSVRKLSIHRNMCNEYPACEIHCSFLTKFKGGKTKKGGFKLSSFFLGPQTLTKFSILNGHPKLILTDTLGLVLKILVRIPFHIIP